MQRYLCGFITSLFIFTGVKAQKIDARLTSLQRVSKNTKGLIIYKGKAYFNK